MKSLTDDSKKAEFLLSTVGFFFPLVLCVCLCMCACPCSFKFYFTNEEIKKQSKDRKIKCAIFMRSISYTRSSALIPPLNQ